MKANKPISDRFRADRSRHYLSMISKITPSPDWFVGVDRFDLCNATDCSWKNNITFQLGPMDAGKIDYCYCDGWFTLRKFSFDRQFLFVL